MTATACPISAPITPPVLAAPLLDALRLLAAGAGGPAWLVGGGLRDRIGGHPVADIDIVVASGALASAERAAARHRGSVFVMDPVREIVRVVWRVQGRSVVLDIAQLAGAGLAEDLAARDFTVNALALALDEPGLAALEAGGDRLAALLIDPFGGLEDLRARRLRMVAPGNLAADRVRLLRALRLSVAQDLTVEPATEAAVRALAPGLRQAPPERLRAEWLRTLGAPGAELALDRAEQLGLLDALLPALAAGRDCPQSPPHDRDVYRHSLDAAGAMAWILSSLLDRDGDASVRADGLGCALRPAAAPRRALGPIPPPFAAALRAEAPRLSAYLAGQASWDEQPRRAWLVLAALLHDLGKPATARWEEGTEPRWRYPNHAAEGARLALSVAADLRVARPAASYLETLVGGHMLPLWLSTGPPVDGRALHRYFRATGAFGVDVALLALADNSAKAALPLAAAERIADVFRQVCAAWFEDRDRLVDVALPVDGHGLIQAFDLRPGPQLGHLLAGLREAVAAGELDPADREGALAWVRRRL